MQQEQEQEYEEFEELHEHDETGFMSYEELLEARKITFTDIKEHITGPVISVVLHVILLAFLGTIVVFEAPKESKEIEVEMKVLDPPEIEKIPEPPPEPEEVVTEVEVEITRPEVATENVEVTVEDVAVKNTDVQIDLPNVLSVKPNNSALKMPALMSSRSGSGRKAALKKYGGTGKTETAVLRGLRWLKDHQNPDGSWGDTSKGNFAAYTGMALLAFLAHGDTPSSAEFGPTVKKAIQKLVEMVGPNADKVKGGYRHAIAMYALSEAYALTQIPMLEDVVNKGIQRIILGMNPAGSFDYGLKVGERSDLSVAGWNYQALKAAFAAGCTAEGLEDAITNAVNKGLKETHWNSGRNMFTYGPNGKGPKSTMTAVGVLCLQLYGEGKCQEAKAGLATLESPNYFWFSWDNNPTAEQPPGWALYQWYYQTQAIFQGNSGTGGTWKKWNKMFTTELLAKQKKDGRWETPAFEHDPTKGGHGEAMFKGLDQPVYATSLCCLMLEVYYRYLPTFKVAHVKAAEAANAAGGGDSDDDLGLSLE